MNLINKLSLITFTLLLTACTITPIVTDEDKTEETPPVAPVQEERHTPSVDTAVTSSSAVQTLLTTSYAQVQSGNQTAAIASLERAIRIAPRFPESYLRLAEIKYNQGHYNQARSLAQKAISLGAEDDILSESKMMLENTLK